MRTINKFINSDFLFKVGIQTHGRPDFETYTEFLKYKEELDKNQDSFVIKLSCFNLSILLWFIATYWQ